MIEKRVDEVYLNGKKLTLHRSERQINGKTVQGHELLLEVENLPVHNATLHDFFMANPAYVPEDWKKDENGNTIYIFFWGTLFLSPSGDCVYVRYGCWSGDRWVSDYLWLGNRWGARNPAVVSAS